MQTFLLECFRSRKLLMREVFVAKVIIVSQNFSLRDIMKPIVKQLSNAL